MKIRIVLCLGLCLLMTAQVRVATAHALTAREAIDGDTLILEGGERIRLIGIDTPELKDEYGRNARTALRTRATKKMVQHYAIEARNVASEWVKGQKLMLLYDPANKESNNLDDFGRTLAYVCRESDSTCLAERLVEDGYALVYRRFDFKRKKDFIKLEDRARKSQKHLWQNQPSPVSSQKTTTSTI